VELFEAAFELLVAMVPRSVENVDKYPARAVRSELKVTRYPAIAELFVAALVLFVPIVARFAAKMVRYPFMVERYPFNAVK